jgi:Na+-driven multidrug efflux pump
LKHQAKLTTGSIPRTLFTFALPILLGNVMQSVNGSINAIWIGKYLGPAALTGANNGNIVVFLLFGAVFGITMAATIMIGRAVGAGETAEAKRVVGSSASFFFAVSLLLAALGFLLAPSILHWMGTPEDARAYGIDYLRVLFVALPASNAFFFVSAALRAASWPCRWCSTSCSTRSSSSVGGRCRRSASRDPRSPRWSRSAWRSACCCAMSTA